MYPCCCNDFNSLFFLQLSNIPLWVSLWLSGKEPLCQCRRCRFDPWVRKIPWKRRWQLTPVFLPEKSHQWLLRLGLSLLWTRVQSLVRKMKIPQTTRCGPPKKRKARKKENDNQTDASLNRSQAASGSVSQALQSALLSLRQSWCLSQHCLSVLSCIL